MTDHMTRRTTCAVCAAPLPKRRRTYCSADCALLVYRTYPARKYRESEAYRVKQRARAKAYHHLIRHGPGPQPCKACGAEKAEMHHDHYDQPLDVRWLCPPCHDAMHRKERAA